jgi:hypothetical protein
MYINRYDIIWNSQIMALYLSYYLYRKFDFSAEFYLICSGRISIYCPIKMTTDTMDNLQKVSAQFQLSLKVFDANIAWLAWGIQTNPGNFHHIMDVLKRRLRACEGFQIFRLSYNHGDYKTFADIKALLWKGRLKRQRWTSNADLSIFQNVTFE